MDIITLLHLRNGNEIFFKLLVIVLENPLSGDLRTREFFTNFSFKNRHKDMLLAITKVLFNEDEVVLLHAGILMFIERIDKLINFSIV